MIKQVRMIFSVVLLCLQQIVALAYIMGPDDRSVVTEEDSKKPGIRQIGIIDTRDGGFVTGIVTGANCDVVISAGHAAFQWETDELLGKVKGAPRGEGNLLFFPDPNKQDGGLKIALVKSGYEDIDNVGADMHDWSIFRLEGPVFKDCSVIKYIRNRVECNGQVYFPAYHFDKRSSKLIDKTCSVRDSMGKTIIVHDCDSKDGSSGAPLLCVIGKDMTLIGINISGQALKKANNPTTFGKDGEAFHSRHRKNFALSIHGEFSRALQNELRASERRKIPRNE